VDAPPIVDENIEYTQDENEERRGPLGLEANSNHRAGGETNQRDKRTSNAPLATECETNEKEDKQDTAR
jgi:hypothetical protein